MELIVVRNSKYGNSTGENLSIDSNRRIDLNWLYDDAWNQIKEERNLRLFSSYFR